MIATDVETYASRSVGATSLRPCATFRCRLTAPFSGRPGALQHAGAQDLFWHGLSSPAAKHFIDPGPLQRFVRRRIV
jgi:hypothetical protein